jgi:hypothetical protein
MGWFISRSRKASKARFIRTGSHKRNFLSTQQVGGTSK